MDLKNIKNNGQLCLSSPVRILADNLQIADQVYYSLRKG